MSRICELENAKTELSVRLRELEGVMMCEDKPMDVMPLSSRVPDRSMKVTDEADALSKHNKELMTEVDLLRSKISERVTLLDDVCMEMDEVRGSLGFLLKQVKELRAAHAEANADRADMANRMSEYERASRRLCETVGRSTSPVQDIDYAHEGLSTDRCTSDGLREDLQRALDTQSFELEAVTEKLKECESMNNALICECESLKRRLESYMTVTTDLENDVTKTKGLLAFVVDHIRGLRSDYGDWCREHEQQVQECLDAVATGLSHGVVEHVDRECETMTWPEHLESTVMLDSFVRLHESHEVTSMQREQDWDSVSEMSRLCDRNRELSEELCKCRDLCDKQACEMVSMQTALRQAVEQASTAREELEAYRHEKVCAISDLEGRLSASHDECSALRDEVCRLETSMEEHCNTVLAIANRDWESRVDEIVRERNTAMKELLELRSRLDMTDDVDARLSKAVCRSDMGTDMLDRMIEHDIALSSGFTSDTRETVSVGVGKDAEDDESNCMVVDGWSDYSSECIHDEHKPSVSVGSPTRLVSVETQVTESVSWLATDTLSTSGFTDQSTRSPVEMKREKLVSSSLCEDESNVVDELREELASCYEQIVKLSRSVEESDASLMDVRRLLTMKESEVADLREEKRHLRDEVNELREIVEAEPRDLDIMRADVDVLESKEEVSAMCVESRGPNVVAVEEECVQTEIDDDVFDLVSTLQLEVAHLREENAATLAALERSQLELTMKQTEVQELESRIVVNETTWSIPCETVRKASDVVVRELVEVDDTDRVEADVFAGFPDRQLVETVAGDSVSGIVPDRMDRQTTDLCVEGVSNEEAVSPIHATQSWTKPPSEEDNDDAELALLNTDSLRARLKEAMSRICELENAKTELSVRLRELEGVMMCEDKPMDVMPLSSRVPDRSMKVTDEADALSKHNKELMTEVDLLRSKISERVTLLDDVCMEMDEVRGSLGFLLKQVKELRAAHAEANADRADMANRMSEYERASRRLCETVGRSTSPVQDIDYAHEGLSTDRCTSDGLREDLQRALDTQSFELEAVTEKLKECESMNNALICECESLKRRLESYMTVTTDLENDVTKTKGLLAFVVDHIRGLRSDYGDWCREHEQQVQECLDAVATGLSHGVVEHVDRECETMTWPEHLESTVMLDSFVRLHESHEVTSMQREQDWDSINEMSRLSVRNLKPSDICFSSRHLSNQLSCCNNSSIEYDHGLFLHDELSDLKQNFSKISMSLAFSIDFVELCMKLLTMFVNLFIDLSKLSFIAFDFIFCEEFVNLLSDIISFSKSSNFIHIFGNYSNSLTNISNLYELLLLSGCLNTCSLCKIQYDYNHRFLCNLCIHCISSIKNLDIHHNINLMNNTNDNTDHDYNMNTSKDLLSDHYYSNTILSQQSIIDKTQQIDFEHKFIIAKSEINRLSHLLYNIRLNQYNEHEEENVPNVLLSQQQEVEQQQQKQQLYKLNHSILQTGNSLLNRINIIITKIEMIQTHINNLKYNQQLINLKKINHQWKININMILNNLLILINKINNDHNIATTIPTTTIITKDILSMTNDNLNEFNYSNYSINILYPNEIIPIFNILMNDFHNYINRIGIIENRYNLFYDQLNKQCNQLNDEINQLQLLIYNQIPIIDNIVTNNLVTMSTEVNHDNDDNDDDNNNNNNNTENLPINIDIKNIIEKIKLYTNQLNSIKRQIKQQIEQKKIEHNKTLDDDDDEEEDNTNVENKVIEDSYTLHSYTLNEKELSLSKNSETIECSKQIKSIFKEVNNMKDEIFMIKTIIFNIKDYMNKIIEENFHIIEQSLPDVRRDNYSNEFRDTPVIDSTDEMISSFIKVPITMDPKQLGGSSDVSRIVEEQSLPDVRRDYYSNEFRDTAVIDSTDEMISLLNEVAITTEVPITMDPKQSDGSSDVSRIVEEQSLPDVRRDYYSNEFRDTAVIDSTDEMISSFIKVPITMDPKQSDGSSDVSRIVEEQSLPDVRRDYYLNEFRDTPVIDSTDEMISLLNQVPITTEVPITMDPKQSDGSSDVSRIVEEQSLPDVRRDYYLNEFRDTAVIDSTDEMISLLNEVAITTEVPITMDPKQSDGSSDVSRIVEEQSLPDVRRDYYSNEFRDTPVIDSTDEMISLLNQVPITTEVPITMDPKQSDGSSDVSRIVEEQSLPDVRRDYYLNEFRDTPVIDSTDEMISLLNQVPITTEVPITMDPKQSDGSSDVSRIVEEQSLPDVRRDYYLNEFRDTPVIDSTDEMISLLNEVAITTEVPITMDPKQSDGSSDVSRIVEEQSLPDVRRDYYLNEFRDTPVIDSRDEMISLLNQVPITTEVPITMDPKQSDGSSDVSRIVEEQSLPDVRTDNYLNVFRDTAVIDSTDEMISLLNEVAITTEVPITMDPKQSDGSSDVSRIVEEQSLPDVRRDNYSNEFRDTAVIDSADEMISSLNKVPITMDPKQLDGSSDVNRIQYTLNYALRLLHLRDTELLYIISIIYNKLPNESINHIQYNLSSSSSILTNQVLKEKLNKFLYWENIDPIDINSIPIHRIHFNMLESKESTEQQINTISSNFKNQLNINVETIEITDQSTTGQISYHEDIDWYEQHLYTLVQNALNVLNQMNQHFLESKKPLLSEYRQEELINILTKLLTIIPINNNIIQQQIQSSFSFSPSLTSSLLEEHPGCSTTVTNIMTTTTSGFTYSIQTLSFTTSTNTTTTTTSFKQSKQISEISNLNFTKNLTYPRRSEKTSINELINSVDHLRNLHELRSLAKYLLDQYHIVTSELDLQSDTNWCLRQRLTNANSQLNRLTGLLNKSSQGLSSIEEDLSLGTDKTSLRSEHYDGIRYKSLQPTYTLNNFQEKNTTSGRRLNFIPSSDEQLIKSSYSSSIQTMENKSILKSKSKSEISSMTSRISDPDYFITHGMYIPMRIMQSISSQTVKHKKISCLPRNTFNCGPILKRSSIRQRSNKYPYPSEYHDHLSTDGTNQSLSNNLKLYNHCINDKSIEIIHRTITSSTPLLTTTLTNSSKQFDNNNNNNNNNNNPKIIRSHWNELETNQQKLHNISMSIIKDSKHDQNQSSSISVSSTMNNDNDIIYNEKQSLLHEYNNNNNNNSSNSIHQLPQSSITTRTITPAAASTTTTTITSHSSESSTSSSFSFTSFHSHPYSNERIPVKSRKTKFHSRFLNLFKSNFKK
ncbi:unnamed protein product [Schistosoma spindalis]|nr:unnamed protein product [Schistosoma spindale]